MHEHNRTLFFLMDLVFNVLNSVCQSGIQGDGFAYRDCRKGKFSIVYSKWVSKVDMEGTEQCADKELEREIETRHSFTPCGIFDRIVTPCLFTIKVLIPKADIIQHLQTF